MRFSIVFALVAVTLSLSAHGMILPRNHLDREDHFGFSNVSEEQFNKIVDSIVALWKPIAKQHGANLVANKSWNDSTVNAYAQQEGNTWKVSFFGGLARRPEVTPDGFALVVCHELGHHFGGYAFYGGRWAASEGESDYWATQVCARRIWWKSTEKNERLARRVSSPIEEKCNQAWTSEDDRALCYRIAEGGLSLAKLLGALGGRGEPKVSTPDSMKVPRTITYHPAAQCRLDTYLNGALCTQKPTLKIIPGKKDGVGYNTPEAEAEAGKYSCMTSDNFQFGFRPRCWFKPLVGTSIRALADTQTEELPVEMGGSAQ